MEWYRRTRCRIFPARIFHESERLIKSGCRYHSAFRLDEKNGEETMFETGLTSDELGEDVINNLQNRAAKKKINLEYQADLHRCREYAMYYMKCSTILQIMLSAIPRMVEM